MFPQDIIHQKREGLSLSKEQIDIFIEGLHNGLFKDYQASALLMAIFFNGMDTNEIYHLTDALMHSGDMINLDQIPGIKVDKHSTGGVGDKVSLILAPLAAACGVYVPMMSGRGLGHTGGTIDKLESIEGFQINLTISKFKKILKNVGCAMIGQTKTLVPADKKLYALRDVTATVESIPLICASIMSKKIAEGIDSLVLDVKVGTGAFMKNINDATTLAKMMVETGKKLKKPTVAVLTDMNQPLGYNVGNSLEIIETIECLKNKGPEDLMNVTYELTAHMIYMAKQAATLAESRKKVKKVLSSGKALEVFASLIEKQGGNPRIIDKYSLLPKAKKRLALTYIPRSLLKKSGPQKGYVHQVDALLIGKACHALGSGRASIDDKIDPAVGINNICKIGQPISEGKVLCQIHYNSKKQLNNAIKYLQKAFVIKRHAVEAPKLILKTIR